MKKSWKIHTAKEKDFNPWMKFVRGVQMEFHGLDLEKDPKYRDAVLKNIIRGTAICVKDKSGGIIGAMIYSPVSNHIGWLAVSPECRRQGVGTSLVQHMFRQFDPDTQIKVKTFLNTDPPGPAAQSFYKSLGFEAGNVESDLENQNGGKPFRVFRSRSRQTENA